MIDLSKVSADEVREILERDFKEQERVFKFRHARNGPSDARATKVSNTEKRWDNQGYPLTDLEGE